nr:MAG TPA: hypothetical protein [Caudoviricetes sp.]DAO33337.1 MAG TPA: hypothetical protein [Caudoviricetes sp.]DAY97996.1 MAG TPA: hypothetical protein [Caudoviricetes sp.]DAZ07564.1 MAG TPA: hypothetical protein [Caudoviricetes sp.]
MVFFIISCEFQKCNYFFRFRLKSFLKGLTGYIFCDILKVS